MDKPDWLPTEIPFANDWSAFIQKLHAIFTIDFKRGTPRLRNRPVWFDQNVEPDDEYGFEDGFWHLVTRDQWVWNPKLRKNEKQRYPEFTRAGKLPWIRPIIEHASDPAVLVWESDEPMKRGGVAIRTYLWLKEHDYVVVLQYKQREKGDIFNLVTAYSVDEKGRIDLESRFARRLS